MASAIPAIAGAKVAQSAMEIVKAPVVGYRHTERYKKGKKEIEDSISAEIRVWELGVLSIGGALLYYSGALGPSPFSKQPSSGPNLLQAVVNGFNYVYTLGGKVP